MIEVSLGAIINNINIFQEISNKKDTIPAVTAYKIARILIALENEIKFFQETRKILVEKYCQRLEDGGIKTDENGGILLKEDMVEDFNKESEDLLETIVELNVMPLKLEELDNLNFSISQMSVLMPFIQE